MINTEYWKKYIFIVNGVDSMTRVFCLVEQGKRLSFKEKRGRLYGPIQQIIS